jgi:cobalt/nickel transport system ATP-binding protein
VILAALLVYEPKLLLLDEPTAAMDPKTTGWFIDLLLELDITVVLATHDLSLAYEVSDRAVVIDQKHQKIYDGDIEKLYEDLELLVQANLIHKHRHKHKDFSHSHYHKHF